mmetsp:Transcript_63416/g.131493  ORF Transcript_63416/g.131493 Transcript_63416/m.131493 type:complete len:253 (+) Transcript_63416:107-865(+)
MSSLLRKCLAAGILLEPLAMDLTCVTSGHAMSEDVIEQCESDLLDAQEVSLLQMDHQVDLHGSAQLENADDGDGDGDGDADAFGNSDSSSASLRQNITLEEVAFVQEATNRTSVALQSLDVLGHLEYELQVGAGPSAKSKVALALMELTVVPGVLGLDRCYMGQCGLGIVKAATFGGLTVWFIFDFLAVVMTCLSGHKYMNAFGMKGKFIDNEITFAFWLALVWILGMFMVCCTQSVKMMTRPTPVPGKNSP